MLHARRPDTARRPTSCILVNREYAFCFAGTEPGRARPGCCLRTLRQPSTRFESVAHLRWGGRTGSSWPWADRSRCSRRFSVGGYDLALVWPDALVLTNPVLDQGASGGIDRAEEPKLDVCSARVSGLPNAMARACPHLCAVVSFSTWLAWTSTSGCSSARPATDTKDHRLGQGP